MFRKEWNAINKKNLVSIIFGDPSLGRRLDFINLKKKFFNSIISDATILDAGCGQGFYSFYINRKFNIKRIDAIDFDDENIIKCKIINEKLGSDKINFMCADMVEYKKVDEYNLVYALASTHYVGDRDDVIFSNFFESLKDGGVLLLVVPHKDIRERVYKRKIDRYSREQIKDKLTSAGFKEIKIKPFSNGINNNIKVSFGKNTSKGFIRKVISLPIFIFGIVSIRFDDLFYNRSNNASWVISAKKN